ncbi:T9SS type A sorting domain-containing protein, partial [Caldithrix abyssi]
STENGTPIPEESKRWLQVFEFGANVPTGIENNWKVITAEDYVLKQNYPNPFNPTTTIEFYLPIKKQISLTIYNALGQKVKTLINNEVLSAGNHALQWDGTNDAGAKVASGMYIYELKYGNFKQQKRMMLMK